MIKFHRPPTLAGQPDSVSKYFCSVGGREIEEAQNDRCP